ncbi:MAG: hypothetical protein HQM03_21005 [Magnetococcales bacterium]|nr:hypothetical protein [Magnetococcales bacterium]
MEGAALPPLREELTLHPAPPAPDGAPTWTLADPARNLYFRIDWAAFEMLARWDTGQVQPLVERIAAETTLHLEPDAVEEVVRFLEQNHLLRAVDARASQTMARMLQMQKGHWLRWLLHHYLFFRVPLVRPDVWLQRLLPWTGWFFSPIFFFGLAVMALLTILLLFRQWDAFHTALVNAISPMGLLQYGVALLGVKSLHELGHAVTAKRHGCRVPVMGVAFLVMFPMLYTDTTEAWKLADKRKRLAIAMGGLAVEGVLAVVALFSWLVLPAGVVRDTAFWIATASLSATLMVNLSPFMRFDGYFILADALDLPNLHERSSAMARWWIREVLFDLGELAPESCTPAMRRFHILFALATWLYRLLLFLGIALLVYHFVVKVVGILLFAVEIGWFIVLPIQRELRVWGGLGARMRVRWRLPLLVGLMLLAVLFPWSHHVSAPALAQGETFVRLYVPENALLERPPPAGAVQVGEGLFVFSSPDLLREARLARLRRGMAEWESALAGLGTGLARRARLAREERERAASTLAGLEASLARLVMSAPAAGALSIPPPEPMSGSWLKAGMSLGLVVDDARLMVEGYAGEEALGRIPPGAMGWFVPEVPEYPRLPVRLERIDPMAIAQLEEPVLASLYGGAIPVRYHDGALQPEVAVYRMRMRAGRPADWPSLRLRGTVHLEALPQSLLERWILPAVMVLAREWNL